MSSTPGGAPTLGTNRSAKRVRLALAVVLVAVVLVGAALALWLTAPSKPLRMTVSLSPESPGASEPFTVTAIVEGGGPLSPVDVIILYEAYFNASSDGGGGPPHEGNRWSLSLPGFPNGTEVWILVAAATANRPPLFEHRIVQIGVIRGGASGLSISDVARIPERPDALDTVRVSARVESKANITEVLLLARSFWWRFEGLGMGSRSGGGGGPMLEEEPGNFSAFLEGGLVPAPGPGGSGSERGTIWIYRVVAWDETGNTAATAVEMFTIA